MPCTDSTQESDGLTGRGEKPFTESMLLKSNLKVLVQLREEENMKTLCDR